MSDGPNTPNDPKPESTPSPSPAPTPTPTPTSTPAPTPASSPKADAKPIVSTTHENESTAGRIVRAVFGILLWPLRMLFRPLVFRVNREHGNPKVYFTSFSSLFYLWPIMAVGFLGCALESMEFVKDSSATFGWIWITTVIVVLITVAADVDRNKLLVLVGLILLFWMGGYILQRNQDIMILSGIHDFFAKQHVKFNAGTAMVMSVIILIILIGVIVVAWFDGRYEITTREITHRRAFRTSDSLPRAAKRIKQDWRDLAEAFIGLGAGDVIVLDTQKNIVMRIPNVPFLWFFKHDVDHVLEVLATTDIDDIAAAMDEEDDM